MSETEQNADLTTALVGDGVSGDGTEENPYEVSEAAMDQRLADYRAKRNLRYVSTVLLETFGNPTIYCPGCDCTHIIPAVKPLGSVPKHWTWDMNKENPSFQPSMKISTTVKGQERVSCHFILTNGILHFCSDSAHDLAGKNVPLPAIPKVFLEEKVHFERPSWE